MTHKPYYIDSHCHLNHRKIAEMGTPTEIITRAKDAGVAGMLTICCRMDHEIPVLRDIADNHENVWCSVGTHPHDTSKDEEKRFTTDDIVRFANEHDKTIGIGECGLDYFYDFGSPEDQATGFRNHIRAAIKTNLPIIIHARDADEDIIRILKEEGAGKNPNLRGVMHCFSSGAQMAQEALDFGFYISFSGIVTFKNAEALRDIARNVPQDRFLIETDAPYLTPEPNRKVTNEPAHVINTAKCLADIYDLTRDEVGEKSANNFFDLFTKAKDTWVQP